MGHNILNTSDGLYAFGENDCGQLGLGDYEDRTSPKGPLPLYKITF